MLNTKNNMNFKINFISLITPFIFTNIRLSYINTNTKKVFLKQSYILLTWFYYLNFINITSKNKNNIKIFVLPLYRKKFTLTKAPMAHKNWSKEQYKIEYYKFIISFKMNFHEENNINSLNKALLFVMLIKKNFPQFETNIFFLKFVNFFFIFTDKFFFNYNNFLLIKNN